MSDQTFTQEQVNQAIADAKAKWESETFQPLQTEVEELRKFKPKDETEQEKEIKKLKADLLQAKVTSALKDANLDDFVDFLDVTDEKDLDGKISKLSKVLDDRKLRNSYVPDDHKQTDKYSTAKQHGDNIGMLKSIFNLK